MKHRNACNEYSEQDHILRMLRAFERNQGLTFNWKTLFPKSRSSNEDHGQKFCNRSGYIS
jgi:hypothetical protein